MKPITVLLSVLFVVSFLTAASAQEHKVVNGGVLNGRAKSLPKPEYPEAAKAAKVEGMIAVDVEISESGVVTSAKADLYDQRVRTASDGTKLDPVLADSMLRQAAVDAAKQATFLPTMLSGEPVKVKGRIVYNFVAGDGGGMVAEAQRPRTPAEVRTVDGSEPKFPKMVSGGVLNGKATSLPSPAYPAAAKAVGAEGAVSVQVLIDEEGSVVAATAASGHPLLRAAAEEAAKAARFSPTVLSGQPVKVSGVVTYNFVLPKKVDQ